MLLNGADEGMKEIDPRPVLFSVILHLVMIYLSVDDLHRLWSASSALIAGLYLNAHKQWFARIRIIASSILIVNVLYFVIRQFYEVGGSQLAVTFRLLFVLLTTLMLASTENIEKLYNTLVSVGFPAKFAWMISTAIRRSVFAVEEIEQTFRVLKGNPKLSEKLTWKNPQGFVSLLAITWAKALRRAADFDTSLVTRGYTGTHFDLYIDELKVTKYELVFCLLSALSFLAFLII